MYLALSRTSAIVANKSPIDGAHVAGTRSTRDTGGSLVGSVVLPFEWRGEREAEITDGSILVLQSGDGYHVAALLGIVLLAVIGGALVARNRLQARRTPERGETRTDTRNVMTDREKVRHLVKENGGRMKQSEIVDSVEWSKAKVSRLLADLETDGEITKLRLGRENLVCLPGNEPAASRSSEHRPGE